MKKFLKFKQFILITTNLLSIILILLLFSEIKNTLTVKFVNSHNFSSETIKKVEDIFKFGLIQNKINFEQKNTHLIIFDININIKKINSLLIQGLLDEIKKKNAYYYLLDKDENLFLRINNHQFIINHLEGELLLAKKLDIKYPVLEIAKIYGPYSYNNGYLILEETLKLLKKDLRAMEKDLDRLIQLIKENEFLIYTHSNYYKFKFKTWILLLVYFSNVLLYFLLYFKNIKKLSKS